VGAGTVVTGAAVVVGMWDRAALNWIVGAAAAERGEPVRSMANVTIIARPSIPTTISFGNATKRPNPDPRT
jgi:hypothetical protein